MRQFLVCLVLGLFIIACGSETPDKKPKKKKPVAEAKKIDGEVVFLKHCVACHGANGKMGINGAKDFTLSELNTEEMVEVITNGRNTMLPYKNILKPAEIQAVAEHVQNFKKK